MENRVRPNVIYILADDLGYGDISAYNEKCPFETPNLDNMCNEGIKFTDAHASSAVCTPSRYSILTGRYNWRSRLKSSVLGGYSSPLIEDNRKTVADVFKSQGYRTAAIGKWHLGMDFSKKDNFIEAPDFDYSEGIDYDKPIQKSPIDYGFDYYYGISASLDMPPYVYIENNRFTKTPTVKTAGTGKGYWRKGLAAEGFIHENVLGELTDKLIEKISEESNDPYFVYFPITGPHTPILPSKEFLGKSGTNEYGDFVLQCDYEVGRIINKLKELGQYDNTIVIVTSDNGCSPEANYEELGEKGHNPSYIFRGTKSDIFEGGHRIPLIVQWPEKMPKGISCEKVVCLSDFMATMAEYFDVTLDDDMGEDSVSNLPLWLLQDDKEVRDDVIHQSIDGSLSIRKGKYKLCMCPGSGGWSYPASGDNTDSLPAFQLYDLEKDIEEEHNIIDENVQVYEQLKEVLYKYITNGRSTPGTSQKNNGAEIWETVNWIKEM